MNCDTNNRAFIFPSPCKQILHTHVSFQHLSLALEMLEMRCNFWLRFSSLQAWNNQTFARNRSLKLDGYTEALLSFDDIKQAKLLVQIAPATFWQQRHCVASPKIRFSRQFSRIKCGGGRPIRTFYLRLAAKGFAAAASAAATEASCSARSSVATARCDALPSWSSKENVGRGGNAPVANWSCSSP